MTSDTQHTSGRPKLSFNGFRDPVRRPRYIIWTAVVVLVIAAVMITALGVTSTRWFCSEGCHKVQDDTITAYEHSAHSQISCMACHMPVNANPAVFILHKAEALGELYLTVTNNFELPLNPDSELALTMESTQCTQCHNLDLRPVSATKGIIIDHEAHAEYEEAIECTICHNRTAHVEDFTLTLSDPRTKEPNQPHADFMSMTACFRCHTQDPKQGETEVPQAPGACLTCHPEDFELRPASHLAPGFFPEGHAVLASEETSRARQAEARHAKASAEESESGRHGGEESLGMKLPPADAMTSCSTCHSEKFCSDCHGVPMPHPPAFRKGHGELGKKDAKVCGNCHKGGEQFCSRCHHADTLGYEYDPSVKWISIHPKATSQVGAAVCLDCHNPTYCSDCHVNGP